MDYSHGDPWLCLHYLSFSLIVVARLTSFVERETRRGGDQPVSRSISDKCVSFTIRLAALLACSHLKVSVNFDICEVIETCYMCHII